jgi:hypothetical protein
MNRMMAIKGNSLRERLQELVGETYRVTVYTDLPFVLVKIGDAGGRGEASWKSYNVSHFPTMSDFVNHIHFDFLFPR